MLLEIVAAVAAAFGAAGLVLIARVLTRGLIPVWFVPAAAGLGMIAFTIWNEYDWARRAEAALPADVTVVWRNAESAMWRPWTYVVPLTTRFTAVDLRNPRRHAEQPGQVIAGLVMMARRMPGAEIPVVFDCPAGRFAELVGDDILFGEDGGIGGANWQARPPGDPMLRAVCDNGV